MRNYEINGQVVSIIELTKAWLEKQENEEKRRMQAERAKRYGIGPKEGGRLTPPADFPSDPEMYGDPVNFRYPADKEHARPALSYFNQTGQMEAGGYNEAEWAKIGRRLAALISNHLQADYEFAAGKLRQKTQKEAVINKDTTNNILDDSGGRVIGGPISPGISYMVSGDNREVIVPKKKAVEITIIAKQAKKQIAYGVILRPNVADADGDLYDEEEVEKAAHRYMADYAGAADWLHREDLGRETAVMVESFIAPVDFDWDGFQVLKGDWLGGMWVKDKERWQKIEAGEINAFSINGYGHRRPLS